MCHKTEWGYYTEYYELIISECFNTTIIQITENYQFQQSAISEQFISI
jgi:hypothetical protein